MFKINDNYQKLPGSYLFSTIAKKVNAYSAANPEKQIIRLGIGDVTQPIARLLLKQCTKQSMRWDMQKRSMAMRRILDMTF